MLCLGAIVGSLGVEEMQSIPSFAVLFTNLQAYNFFGLRISLRLQ